MKNKETSSEYGVMRSVIPGITADARTLGVTREHLWRVLKGKRESQRLILAYKKLQIKKQRKAGL